MDFIDSTIPLILVTKKLNPPFNTFPSTFILPKIVHLLAIYTLYLNIVYFLVLGRSI